MCLISFKNFYELLPVFTCARNLDNFPSICLGVNILSLVPFLNGVNNVLLVLAVSVRSLECFYSLRFKIFSFQML